MNVTLESEISGRIEAEVIDAATGEVISTHRQKNLILDSGLDLFYKSASSGLDLLGKAHAGTGTTPNKVLFDGTFSQSGTTVTRSSGVGVFAAGDVGKRLKFGTGQRGKITAFTSTTQVTLSVSQTVAATTLTKYNTDRTTLVTETETTSTFAATAGSNYAILDPASNVTTEKKTWIFAIRASAVNYTELGFSRNFTPIFSRILLDSPIPVDTGQQLRLAYIVTLTDPVGIVSYPETLAISGWPRPYNISGIASTAFDFTVTFPETHHYIVGGKINIAGALPAKVAITGITSNASNFTVTTGTAHGFLAADSIEIEGCAVTAYNGTYTVASVGSTTTYTVTSAINPGAASDGTTRKSVPGTWYNGEWTVASKTTTTATITSAINPIAAGASGTVVNNLKVATVHPTHSWRGLQDNAGSSGDGNYLFNGTNMACSLRQAASLFTFSGFPQKTAIGGTVSESDVLVRDGLNGKATNTVTFSIDQANFTDIKQLLIAIATNSTYTCAILMTFEELQRKDSGYQLKITLVRQINAELA